MGSVSPFAHTDYFQIFDGVLRNNYDPQPCLDILNIMGIVCGGAAHPSEVTLFMCRSSEHNPNFN